VITGAQVRAARGLLGWTAHELAHRAVVSIAMVDFIEETQGPSSEGFEHLANPSYPRSCWHRICRNHRRATASKQPAIDQVLDGARQTLSARRSFLVCSGNGTQAKATGTPDDCAIRHIGGKRARTRLPCEGRLLQNPQSGPSGSVLSYGLFLATACIDR
jgi:hypothetical protein